MLVRMSTKFKEATSLLNGTPISAAWVQEKLAHALDHIGPVAPLGQGTGKNIRQVTATAAGEGSDEEVLETGQSMSCELKFTIVLAAPKADAEAGKSQKTETFLSLYVKKIQARNFATKDLASLRRDLASCYNEAQFYTHMAPVLRADGFVLPTPVHVESHSYHNSPSGQRVRDSEYLFVLERIDPALYLQHSPLTHSEAVLSLDLLARMHA